MKSFYRCVLCLCLSVLCLTLASCQAADTPVGIAPRAPLSYLVLGYDEAAENTDALLLVCLDRAKPRLSLLQLPRDTYIESGYAQNKLNQLFAARRAAGDTREQALSYVKDTLQDTLGITVDGAVAFGLSAFRSAVDAFGGVEITLPESVTLDTEDGEPALTLSAGTHTIDGATAERFVRYRRRYARGDLGRMDAQKLFLSAFFKTLRSHAGACELLTLASSLEGSYVTDVPTVSLLASLIGHLPALRRADVCYATLPGDAVQSESGLWYYAVNRKGASALLSDMAGADPAAFDLNHRLLRAGDTAFDNIYYDNDLFYRVYDDDDLSKLYVPRT